VYLSARFYFMRYIIFLQIIISCQISSYRRDVVEAFAHLGRYAAQVGRWLPTFWDRLTLECGIGRLSRNVWKQTTRSSQKTSGLNNAQAYETVSKFMRIVTV
jgi:hypothetical protein